MPGDLQKCSDEELARQSQAGSLLAFEELVYRYEARVYGFIANCCRNGTDAQEVTQETFVRAFQAIGQFDCRRSFGPWLFTIARRKCVDQHRATPSTTDEAMPDLPDNNDPAELLARQEERQNLWELARCRLPEAQFQALWLKYAEEMSVAGIAQVLRKTQTYVKVLLFRARQTLARELKATQASARTFHARAGADVNRRHVGSAQHAPTGVGGYTPAVNRAESEIPGSGMPTVSAATKPSPGLEGGSPRHQGEPAGVNLKCVVEVPGVVAGLGSGSGKKGLV